MRATALLLFALLAAGCGGDEADETPPPQAAPQAAPGQRADTVGPATSAEDQAEGEEQERSEAEGRPRAAGQDRAEGQAAPEGPARTEGEAPGPAGAEGERLYTVQVASFLESTSASEWTERLRRRGIPAWTSVAEVGGRTFHRVRVGAVPTITEARRLGSLITGQYEWPVWVTSLTPADRPTEDAVQETRRLLDSG